MKFLTVPHHGRAVPVIDVTHPAFVVTPTDEELARLSEQYVRESTARRDVPAALRAALQQSRLGRGLLAASGGILSGMDTYLLKLGPDNLGADANPIDRAIAASFPALTTRLRLQELAHLLAEGLAPRLAARPRRRLCLINIGGGPAADSWNALIILQSGNPALLAERNIVIAVLDLDAEGPAFGAEAVAALRAAGAPLSQVDVHLEHAAFDWTKAERLQTVLNELRAADAVCGVSSEGALFEYGSDEEVVENLRQIRLATAPDTIVVGSVTRDSAATRASRAATAVATRPRTIDAFRALAERAGWRLERAIERPFTYSIRLETGDRAT